MKKEEVYVVLDTTEKVKQFYDVLIKANELISVVSIDRWREGRTDKTNLGAEFVTSSTNWLGSTNAGQKTKVSIDELAEILGVSDSEFRIGHLVKISDKSEFYNSGLSNPKNVEGKIVAISRTGLPISVKWDNGTRNSYAREDLILVKNIEKENSVQPLTVTREALAEVYPLVCTKWQMSINVALDLAKFKSEIEVTPAYLAEAYEEWPSGKYSTEVKAWLDKYLPKPKVEVEKDLEVFAVVNSKGLFIATYYTELAAKESGLPKDAKIVKLTGTVKVFE